MKQYSKTLDEKDYNTFSEMNFIGSMQDGLWGTFFPHHKHRHWEYGLCLNALIENKAVNILEVGGAGSLFAACAAWAGMEVTVVDPSREGVHLFAAQNMILQLGHAPITFEQVDFFQYQNQKKFDAVVCMSTIDHVAEDESFFKKLLNSVKEGGIFFMTVGFYPGGQRLADGPLRTYNREHLETFIAIAKNHGFEVFGNDPDYSWRGENLCHYSFASLALKRKKRREVPVVLYVNNQKRQRDGVYQFGKRIGNILKNSEKCRFIYLETDSKEEYWEKVDKYKPSGVIYNLHFYNSNMPWIDSSILNLTRKKQIFQVTTFHDLPLGKGFDYYIGTYPDFPENEIVFSTPRPLFRYENRYPVSQIPIMNCFGFIGDQDFVQFAQMVNHEFDDAIVNFHIPYNDAGYGQCPTDVATACRSAITKKGIKVNFTHEFMSDDELLDFLAKGSLNVFLYSKRRGRGCASTLDFALSVKRPIAITKSNAMAHIYNAKPSICVEDRSLKEIMASGFGPLESYYEKWRPEKFIEAYEKIVEKIL
jgi:SAM-dependent methyltransferase